jgi:nitrite reductase/ring-hydroxylating ferredoxin subunit
MQQLAAQLEADQRLDPIADQLGTWFDRVVKPGPVKDLLSGTWFGHPIHPPLTAGVVGMWSGAALLDAFGGEAARPGADTLVGLGVLAAVPTLATGWNELADTDGKPKRLAAIHGVANASVTALFALSWLARKGGFRRVGRLLTLLGVGAVGATAYLGGHLSFVRGVVVNQTAFDKPRTRWSAVLGDDELPEAKLTRATVDGIEIVLYRHGDRVWALSNRCTHRGGPLFRGKVVGSDDEPAVVCPVHGSVFRFDDGAIEQGPAAVPQPSFEARIEGGKVEVRPR